jgi:uncharacterized membrane protein
MRKKWILLAIPAGIAFVALVGFVVMSLWNWLIPAIFGLKAISFVQATGLLVLSKILFGSFHGKSDWGGNRQQFWKKRMAERMENASPEEREKMKAKLSNFWSEKIEEKE